MAQHRIEHVSDTALLVAASRARETAREDALIRDPFAARLAGERGMALVDNAQTPAWSVLGMGLRTHMMDELLGVALDEGVDAVLSLGAGLDARAWRLRLPAELRWTEVDFPEVLDYKFGLLADVAPRCHLTRQSADLNNASERTRVLAEAATDAQRPLLMSEGLLMYLPEETVRGLAMQARESGFRFWLLDSSSSAMLKRAHGDAAEQINAVRAPTHMEGPEVRAVIEECGWRPVERRLYLEEAPKLAMERIRQIVASERGPQPEPGNDGSGVWLYGSGR